MKQQNLPGTNVKFVVKDNVLGVISSTDLTTVSSGIYNGGFRKVKAVLNVSVPDGYSDQHLHADPMQLVYDAKANLGVTAPYTAMLTAARIENMSMVTRQKDAIHITVVATAGWRHGESSGEEIDASHSHGTINIIVLLNGNPTDSCLVSLFLTATEAKTAAMNDYDIRSRYTGDAATGTITDSLSIVTTNEGEAIELGGPASPVGQLVASAVRQAVKEAADKQEGQHLGRPLSRRLAEHQLSIEKIAAELSKSAIIGLNEKDIFDKLQRVLASDSFLGVFLLAAVKMDEDYKKGLIPTELGDVNSLSVKFGGLISQQDNAQKDDLSEVNLPPFTKNALRSILLRSS
jgi:iron complex transport system ATP-binding protein